MYGKLFDSLFTGSMVGAGAPVFAVWAYIIANQKPDRTVGMQVELNPKLLAFIIGETEESIDDTIAYLCAPDPESRTRDHEGRRLIKIGQFDYQVVNGMKYRNIRDEESRRTQNREAKRRERARAPMAKTNGERLFEETGEMPAQ